MVSDVLVAGGRTGGMPVSGRYLGLAWREARPAVQLIFQLRFLAGALLAGAGRSPPQVGHMALGAAGWLCATWYVYLLNGVHDLTEDRCNGSSRPLAVGTLPVDAARSIARALLVVALVSGTAASWQQGALIAAMLGLGWLYSAAPHPQKATASGSMAVIVAAGVLTYLAGWHAGGGAAPSAELAVLAVSMSLWMGLVGMTKDLSDVPGDRAAGRRTLPILLGDRSARLLLAVQALGVGALGCGLAWYHAPQLLPAAAVLLCGTAALAISLSPGISSGERRRRRRPYRLFGITQYALHLVILTRCFF
jgi:4-hydroxybenzoate polyprenyltransferase